jgi:hypothetical protein
VEVEKLKTTSSKRLRVSILLIFTMVVVSNSLPAKAEPPQAPRIENAYSETSSKATVIFYGKVPVVGDLPTTYTAESSPDNLSASTNVLGEGGRGVITIEGLKPSTSYTFIVQAKNQDGLSKSFQSNSITTLGAGLIPIFSEVTSTSTGFTTLVTNFNSAFTYTIRVNKGNASIAPYDGSIVVENIGNPGDQATITVTTSRAGYDSVSNTLTASSRRSNEPSRLIAKLSPSISRSGNTIECSVGSYEFLRNGKYAEAANIASYTFLLEVARENVSIFSTDNFLVSPRFLFPDFSTRISGVSSTGSVKWDISTFEKKSPVRCVIFAVQEGASVSTATPTISEAVITPVRQIRKAISCQKGTVVRKVTGVNPKCPRGYVLVP